MHTISYPFLKSPAVDWDQEHELVRVGVTFAWRRTESIIVSKTRNYFIIIIIIVIVIMTMTCLFGLVTCIFFLSVSIYLFIYLTFLVCLCVVWFYLTLLYLSYVVWYHVILYHVISLTCHCAIFCKFARFLKWDEMRWDEMRRKCVYLAWKNMTRQVYHLFATCLFYWLMIVFYFIDWW